MLVHAFELGLQASLDLVDFLFFDFLLLLILEHLELVVDVVYMNQQLKGNRSGDVD